MPVTSEVVPLLDRAVYSYADVDRTLRLRPGTTRRWLNGYLRKNRLYEPVLREAPLADEAVTWGEFVETRLLSEFRDKGASVQRLRPAVVKLRDEFGRYPLAHAAPFLDVQGRELVRAIQDEVGLPRELRFVVVRSGQGLIAAPGTQRFVDSVAYNDGGEVFQFRPHADNRAVLVNPDYAHGLPAVRATPTEVLREQWMGGESIADIAKLWDLPLHDVEAALRYEARVA